MPEWIECLATIYGGRCALWANSEDCGVFLKLNCPHSPLGPAFRAFRAGPEGAGIDTAISNLGPIKVRK